MAVDPDYEEWVTQRYWEGYMKRPTFRSRGVRRSGGLHVPKKGAPLAEVPDVLRGLVHETDES